MSLNQLNNTQRVRQWALERVIEANKTSLANAPTVNGVLNSAEALAEWVLSGSRRLESVGRDSCTNRDGGLDLLVVDSRDNVPDQRQDVIAGESTGIIPFRRGD